MRVIHGRGHHTPEPTIAHHAQRAGACMGAAISAYRPGDHITRKCRHGRYVTFQLAEVAVTKELFRKILSLIDDLRPKTRSSVGRVDGQVKTTGGVELLQ